MSCFRPCSRLCTMLWIEIRWSFSALVYHPMPFGLMILAWKERLQILKKQLYGQPCLESKRSTLYALISYLSWSVTALLIEYLEPSPKHGQSTPNSPPRNMHLPSLYWPRIYISWRDSFLTASGDPWRGTQDNKKELLPVLYRLVICNRGL